MSGARRTHRTGQPSTPLPTHARQVTRMNVMFWPSRAALSSGVELRQAIEDGSEDTLRATTSPTEKTNFEVCDALERLQPNLFELLAIEGNHFMRNFWGKPIHSARLLAPITVDWENEDERLQFVKCNYLPPTANHWPRVLYENDIGDPKKPSKGFLRGQLIVDAAKAILQSPSSVLLSTSARPGTVRRRRKGIASKQCCYRPREPMNWSVSRQWLVDD
ncbi:hypothetical protein BDV93DRAFT_559969 [Ceratobasidium sp. AG-I]|nr:hypothetical protein BDV93DRAFT_559969 [Ceratobasidium sp. AG-I]